MNKYKWINKEKKVSGEWRKEQKWQSFEKTTKSSLRVKKKIKRLTIKTLLVNWMIKLYYTTTLSYKKLYHPQHNNWT